VIEDEFDHEELFITLLNEKEAEAQGACPINHLCQAFTLKPRDSEAETVGGYITEIAQRIPQKGNTMGDDDFTFTVTEATS
tara:strand:- start:67 stop:309 length:243 start_codon:yes stop_codon:yes gene_type:complete